MLTPDQPQQSPADVFVPAQQQPAAAPPPPVRPKRTAVVVLAIIAGLLFCTTGAFGTLFVLAWKNDTRMSQEIQARNREVGELRAKAKASEDEATKARNERETLRFTIAHDDKCRDAAKEYRAASVAQDQAKMDVAWLKVFSNC